jgi:hypothetical protein
MATSLAAGPRVSRLKVGGGRFGFMVKCSFEEPTLEAALRDQELPVMFQPTICERRLMEIMVIGGSDKIRSIAHFASSDSGCNIQSLRSQFDFNPRSNESNVKSRSLVRCREPFQAAGS